MSGEREAAMAYGRAGVPVFPCSPKKLPITSHGFLDATVDPAQIERWWRRSPYALIGMPTGERTGIAVLDIDVKHGVNGFRTLAGLGYVELPATPTALTPTGGAHLHFDRPESGFRNTVGAHGRGIGAGLDWRCDGGYVILPSPGSGYVWGEWSYENSTRLPVPADLMPREVEATPLTSRLATIGPTVNGLAGVARCLGDAKHGERNRLLFWAAKRFAEAIAAGLINEDDARKILTKAAEHTGLGWQEINKTIHSAFGSEA